MKYGIGTVISTVLALLIVAFAVTESNGKEHKEPMLASTCNDGKFCLYDASDFGVGGMANFRKLALGYEWVGKGWINLRPWDFQNLVDSMVNKRNGTSLLASGRDGNGTRYCAAPWSEDGGLWNNPIRENEAESFKLRTTPYC